MLFCLAGGEQESEKNLPKYVADNCELQIMRDGKGKKHRAHIEAAMLSFCSDVSLLVPHEALSTGIRLLE